MPEFTEEESRICYRWMKYSMGHPLGYNTGLAEFPGDVDYCQADPPGEAGGMFRMDDAEFQALHRIARKVLWAVED